MEQVACVSKANPLNEPGLILDQGETIKGRAAQGGTTTRFYGFNYQIYL